MRTSSIGRVLQQVGGMMAGGSRRRTTTRPGAGRRPVGRRRAPRAGTVSRGGGGVGQIVRRFLR